MSEEVATPTPSAVSEEIATNYEARLLGSLLLNPSQIDDVLNLVGFDDFTRGTHRTLFQAIVAIHDARDPVHITSVHENIARTQALTGGGVSIGMPYLTALTNDAGPVGARADAMKVRQRSALRALANLGERVTTLATNGTALPDAIMEEAQAIVIETGKAISARGPLTENFVPFVRIMEPYLNNLIARSENPDVLDGIKTGLEDVDRYLQFLSPGYHVFAARPGIGKTALAIQLSLNAYESNAERAVDPASVLYMSTEMQGAKLAMRALSNEGGINIYHLRSGRLHENDIERIFPAYRRICERPIWFDPTRGLTTQDLSARVRRFQREMKTRFGVVVVDYLQKVGVPDHIRLSATQPRASYVSSVIEDLARANDNLVFIVLAACNRDQDKRVSKRPVMSDLRESGNIESDADSITFLHRDEQTPGMIELIYAKNREGEPNHTIDLGWDGAYQKFSTIRQRTRAEREAAHQPQQAPPQQASRSSPRGGSHAGSYGSGRS